MVRSWESVRGVLGGSLLRLVLFLLLRLLARLRPLPPLLSCLLPSRWSPPFLLLHLSLLTRLWLLLLPLLLLPLLRCRSGGVSEGARRALGREFLGLTAGAFGGWV